MHLVEEALATDAEQVAHGHGHALFGQHGVDLGLEVRAEVDELGPVTDVLTELTLGWRGDPGLSQASQAQQVDQVGGVALVVLHPPVAPVVAERMGQVHGAPALLDHVGRPVPAVGGFEDHLGVLAGLGQLGRQGNRIVVDPDRVERLSCPVAPHDHAAAPVQVDADILCLLFHGSLLRRLRVGFGTPSVLCTPGPGRREDSRGLFVFARSVSGHAPRCHEIAPGAGRSSRCAHRSSSRGSCAALLHHIKTRLVGAESLEAVV